MVVRKFFLVWFIIIGQTSSAMEIKNSELKQDKERRFSYKDFFDKGRFRKSHVQLIMSNDYFDPRGNNCVVFTVAVGIIANDRFFDCVEGFFESYKKYKSTALLECASPDDGETILHKIIKNIDVIDFTNFLESIFIITHLHPDLIKKTDTKNNNAYYYVNEKNFASLGLEKESICMIISNLIDNHKTPFILEKSKILFWLLSDNLKELSKVFSSYDPKLKPFLNGNVLLSQNKTFAHVLMGCMNKCNFDDYSGYVKVLFQNHPLLVEQKDFHGNVPYAYVGKNTNDIFKKNPEAKLFDNQVELIKNEIKEIKKKNDLVLFFAPLMSIFKK